MKNIYWLVVSTPLKNDGVSSSVGMIFHSQFMMGKSFHPFHGSSHHQPDYLINHY